MIKVKKSLALLQYFGPIGVFNSLYEKIIIDKYRFKSKATRDIPLFPLKDEQSNFLVDQNEREELSIIYLIHFFYPDKAGGTERFIFNLAKAQQQKGNRVNVVTLGRRSKLEYNEIPGGMLCRNYEYEGIPVTEIRYHKAPLGLYYKRIIDEDSIMHSFAMSHIEKHTPDIIHCAYPQPYASFLRVSKEKNIPYIITATDFNILCHYATMVDKRGDFCSGSERGERCRRVCDTYGIKDYIARFEKALELMQSAAVITVPSLFVRSVLEQEMPKVCTYVIPHGIGEDFRSAKPRVKTKNFIYAGTLSELKGVHLLVEAFKKVEGDITLSIYGDGNIIYKNRIRNIASADHRIKLEKPIPANEMAELFQNADCVVIPSIWYETFNFVLREALSCGCITVISRIGAMPEAVSEGRNGFLFEPGSIEAAKIALEKARDFDWNNYKKADFNNIKEESNKYAEVYQHCLNSDKKEQSI